MEAPQAPDSRCLPSTRLMWARQDTGVGILSDCPLPSTDIQDTCPRQAGVTPDASLLVPAGSDPPESDPSGQDAPKENRCHFQPYLDAREVQAGIESGILKRGELWVSGVKPNRAWVKLEGAGKRDPKLFVNNRRYRNRALHGDIVVVRLIQGTVPQKASWLGGVVEEEPILDICTHADKEVSDSDDEVCLGHPVIDTDDVLQLAEVVAIAEKKWRDCCIPCTLHPNIMEEEGEHAGKCKRGVAEVLEGDTFIKALPTDPRMPWILIHIASISSASKKCLKLPGVLNKSKLWQVRISAWKETNVLPLGKLEAVIGESGQAGVETARILLENHLDDHDVDFSEEVFEEARNIVESAQAHFEEETTRRLDLRKKAYLHD